MAESGNQEPVLLAFDAAMGQRHGFGGGAFVFFFRDAPTLTREFVTFEAPAIPIVANVRAAAVADAMLLRTLLVEQVTGSVRWRESVEWMAEHGVTETVEIGAGKALSGMVRRVNREIAVSAVNTPADAAKAAAEIKG